MLTRRDAHEGGEPRTVPPAAAGSRPVGGAEAAPEPPPTSSLAAAGGGALRRESLLRLVCDLVEAELTVAGGRPPGSLPDRARWHATLRIREGVIPEGEIASPEPGLALDSLDLLLVASRVNQFFRMQEWALGEHLIRYRTFGTWAQVAHVALTDRHGREVWDQLTFTTSGSTGQPKEITRARSELEQEVAYLRSRLGGIRRIVSLVPAHHLYGFLWTVLLPDRAGWDVVDARFLSPGQLNAELREGDLIVGFPLRWKVLLRTLDRFPDAVTGVSSAGSLEAEIWAEASRRGLSRLVEIYGSTETGGVGWREAPNTPFEVFPYWTRKDGRPAVDEVAPDELAWIDSRHFELRGRKDRAVKVGGELVDLAGVEDLLRLHEQVADCAVRLEGEQATARLKAFIVPADPGAAPTPAELAAWLAVRVRPAAVPQRFTFGPELPRNAQGKVTDW